MCRGIFRVSRHYLSRSSIFPLVFDVYNPHFILSKIAWKMAYSVKHASGLSDCVLYVTEEKDAFDKVVQLLCDDQFPEFNLAKCGVAFFGTKVANMTRFLTDAAGWGQYNEVAFLPEPDPEGVLLFRSVLVAIIAEHPAFMSKMRIAFAPQFIKKNQTDADEYLNLQATVGAPGFTGIGPTGSHDYVKGLTFLQPQRLARLLKSAIPIVGDWYNNLNLVRDIFNRYSFLAKFRSDLCSLNEAKQELQAQRLQEARHH